MWDILLNMEKSCKCEIKKWASLNILWISWSLWYLLVMPSSTIFSWVEIMSKRYLYILCLFDSYSVNHKPLNIVDTQKGNYLIKTGFVNWNKSEIRSNTKFKWEMLPWQPNENKISRKLLKLTLKQL